MQLPPLTLVASLDKPPAVWKEIAFLPAGDGDDEIGFSPCSDCVLPVPAALAVARDGTLWIADSLKRRIAHFSADGSFLGAIPVKRGPADLVFVGARLYALLDEGKPALVRVERGHLSEEIIVNNDGKPLHVQALIGGQSDLVALIAGAGRLLGAYWALATVNPATGQVSPVPGALVPDFGYMGFVPLLDSPEAAYEIRWSDGAGTTQEREIRFQLERHSKQLRTTVGDTCVRTSTPAGFATLVNLGDRQGRLTGRWYLQVFAGDEQPIFERIPQEGFMGDALRYLTVGDDGSVYWMRLLDDGLHVYRR